MSSSPEASREEDGPRALVDIGANLTHAQFAEDRDAVLARAAAAGVSRILVTGTSVAESRAAADLARRHSGDRARGHPDGRALADEHAHAADGVRLYATAGVHPHEAASWDEDARAALDALLERAEVVAVGECGLDFERDYAPRDVQRRAFEAQVALAAERGRPVFVHDREASDEVVDVLAARRAELPGGVVHCFTAGRAALRRYLELDLHIGITGWICDERRGLDLRDIVADIPDERLLVETDAPYLLPRTLSPRPKSRRNEPAFLPEIVGMVALCRGQSTEHVAACTTENAVRLFGLA